MSTSYRKRMERFVDSGDSPTERLSAVTDAFREINERNNQEAARDILKQVEGTDELGEEKVSIMRHAVQRLRAGDAADLAMIGVATFVGLFAGKYSHKVVDLRPGGVPVNGILGMAAGAGTSLVLMRDMPLGARGAVAALGTGALAGSLMYVNETVEASTIDPIKAN